MASAGCNLVVKAILKELSASLTLNAKDLLETESISEKYLITVVFSYPLATR